MIINKPSQAPPFKLEWCGDIQKLRLLLDDYTLKFFARIGTPNLLEGGGRVYYTIEITPQNGATREILEQYFKDGHSKKRKTESIRSEETWIIPILSNKKAKQCEERSQRTVRFKRKPTRGAVLQDNQRVPQVSIEEQKRRIQEQERINRIGERDRLNIFPSGSNEQRCFKIRNGIQCEGTLALGEVRTPTGTLWMWNCLCGDSVDRIVLQHRGVSLPNLSP